MEITIFFNYFPFFVLYSLSAISETWWIGQITWKVYDKKVKEVTKLEKDQAHVPFPSVSMLTVEIHHLVRNNQSESRGVPIITLVLHCRNIVKVFINIKKAYFLKKIHSAALTQMLSNKTPKLKIHVSLYVDMIIKNK